MSSLPGTVAAEQASQLRPTAAAKLDVGRNYTCAVLDGGSVRCWGYGAEGELGYANTATIGDDESPGSVGPVDLGQGGPATAISTGDFHTCTLLDDGRVRCWGFGADGRLGYANTANVGDDESPGSVGPVDLGQGRTATAISAGFGHTCALLDDGSVRCWGYGENGALGYANTATIGDDESPGSVGPVDLGTGRTATAISAGNDFTCALLDDGSVRCWGLGVDGRLGYGNTNRIGDDETPGSVGPVDLGPERTATAISGGAHGACALLDNATVRCWGEGREGSLGYGDGKYVGDNETPGSVGPVDLGEGRTATAISAGRHSCALLDDGSVRCWGPSTRGQLGYGNTNRIGDDETPGSVGPVDLGAGRTATAISAGELHTCARFADASIRCWGEAGTGQLGYCNTNDIGDDEAPGSVGAVNTTGASDCSVPGPGPPVGDPSPGATPDTDAPSKPDVSRAERRRRRYRRALSAQTLRKREFRACMQRAARRHPRPTPRMPAGVRLRAGNLRRAARGRCVRRHGRTPARVREITASGRSRTKIVLRFRAPGTHGRRLPAARSYLVKQSPSPIRSRREFHRAPALCRGICRFDVTHTGARIRLTVTDLRPRTSYYYAVAALDNVSGRHGQRSPTVRARTRR